VSLCRHHEAGASGAGPGWMRQHSIDGMGGRPHAACHIDSTPMGYLEGMLPGPVRSQGRVARYVIQNWSHVLSAPGRAWNRHGNSGVAASFVR
jgi:hypothetical protein